MRLQRSVVPLAVLALLASGCSAGDARVGSAGDASGGSTASSAQSGTVVQEVPTVAARGVEPCGVLPVTTRSDDVTGERLPGLSLPCLTGGPEINLSRLGGRPVIINLWATWCGPCRDEMPVLQSAYERYGKQVTFLGVDTRDNPHSAAAFLEEVGVTYPQLVDLDGQVLAHLRIPGLPVTVALDATGQVTSRHVGPLTADSLRELVEVMSKGDAGSPTNQ